MTNLSIDRAMAHDWHFNYIIYNVENVFMDEFYSK